MKKFFQKAIRSFHLLSKHTELPERIAIYFHRLPQKQYPAFKECMSWFYENGYQFCSPESFLVEPFQKKIFVSFDDCFLSWFQAMPLFEELHVKATFYVNTAPLRDLADSQTVHAYLKQLKAFQMDDTLSSSELREIHKSGHTIGAHSHSHFMLNQIPLQKAQDEILVSKHCLEQILNIPIIHFSFPFGMRYHFNEALRNYCKLIGFKTIANAIPGMQYQKQRADNIYRTQWNLDCSLEDNLNNLKINGRVFEFLTHRSAIG